MQAPIAPGRGRLYRRLAHDVAVLGLPASPPAPPVIEADLAGLPHAAVRYLTFMGVAGRLADFSTDDRWCDLAGGPVRTRWSTPVAGWTEAGGRWLPARGSAIWHLPEGPFTYAEFRFSRGDVRYNVLPANGVPRHR